MAANPFDFGGSGGGPAKSSSSGNPFDFAAQATKPKEQGGISGLFSDITSTIEKAPSAIAHTVAGAFTDPGGGALLGAGLGGPIGAAIGGGIATVGYGLRGAVTGHWDLPETRRFLEGMQATAGDIAHPGQFLDAYHQGHLVSKLAGDVGNIALLSGGLTKGLDVARGGTLSSATEAMDTAAAATKAAKEAGDALKDATTKFGPAAAAGDVQASQVLNDAGRRAAEASATAQHFGNISDAAVSAAGPSLRAYRIANNIATVGNAGAFAPAKPWAYGGKLLGSAMNTALNKFAPQVKVALGDAAHRVAEWSAIKLHIEHGQDTATALAAPVRRGVLQINQVLKHDGPAAQEAAILDLAQIPHALGGATDALRAAGHHDVAQHLIDHVVSDPELGLSHEGYDLAARVADGTLQRSDPELYARIRQAQQIYRDTIANAAGHTGENIPLSANERYTGAYGSRAPLSEGALAEREWNVTGTGPRPSAVSALERRTEQAREQRTERLVTAQEKLTRTQAREKVEPEAQAKPGDMLGHDYMEAHRLATQVIDRAPTQVLERLFGRTVENIPRHVLVDELRERLFAQRARGDDGSALGALASAGDWRAAGIKVGTRGMAQVRSAAGVGGQIEALQDIQRRAGGRAEASGLKAQLASARVPTEEAIARHGENEAYQAELSREGMGYKPRLEPAAPKRQIGRAEGEEAGAGHVMDTAFNVERRLGRTVEQRQATAGAAGARQVGGAFKQGTEEGARMERTARAAREVGFADKHLSALDEQHARLLQRVADKVTNAPARYRPAIIIAKKANGELSKMADEADRLAPGSGDVIRMAMAELPDTLTKAVDAGLKPEYVIGRRPGSERPPGQGPRGVSAPRPSQALPRRGRTGEETLRKTAAQPTSFAELGRLQVRRIQQQVQNETATHMQHAFGTTPLVELGQPQEGGGHGIPAELARSGARMDQAMREKGYVAWDPANPFQQAPRDSVRSNTVYIPDQVFRSFARHFGPGGKAEQFFRQWYDRPMRAWKSSVLALTTRWHVSHILGHAILGPVGAGIRPVVLGQRMREAAQILKEHPENVPPELLSRGLTSAEAMHTIENPPRNFVGRLAQRSYARVSAVDDMQRVALWLERRNTISDRELIDYRRQHPELGDLSNGQMRDQAAIRLSLRAAGDFVHMAPVERQVFRRVFPFYTWLRHISQLAFHLVAHDPLRVAWLLHLSDLYGDDQQFPFMQGTVSLGGGHYLRLPKINPFQELSLSPGQWLKNLTPFVTVPAALAGRDIKSGNLLGRAPGTYELDAYGRPKATPADLGGKAYLLSNMLPQARLARELYESATGGIRERYPSGQEIKAQGQTQFQHPGFFAGAGSALGSFLGVPQVEKIDVPKEQQVLARRLVTNAKAHARYTASAGGGSNGGRLVGGNPFAFK